MAHCDHYSPTGHNRHLLRGDWRDPEPADHRQPESGSIILASDYLMPEEPGGTASWGTTGDELRALLARQTRAASEEAVRSGGQVAPQQVETLERLARLVALNEAVQRAPSRHRWRLVL